MAEGHKHDWLSLVSVSGLLVSEPVLQTHSPDGPERVPSWPANRLTTEWERFQLKGRDGQSQWLNFVLETLLDIPSERWRRHPAIPNETVHALAEYNQTLKPSRVLVDEEDTPLLLVSIVPPSQGLDARETESGTWRASPSTKLDRLMRAVEVPLGLVTNGEDFRLVYAEAGTTTANITWSAQTWTEERATLNAFHTLLRGERFFGDDDRRLLALVKESQERQMDVTDQLGEQVRAALDEFVRALGRAEQAADGAILADMSFEDIYEMALVFMMRMVFLLYGEENLLLPHGEVLYDHSYGVTHLWTELSRQRQRDEAPTRRPSDAYPRLLANFRLIHQGCDHPDLSLLAYGGKLLDPKRFPALERAHRHISNETVFRILQQLLFARAKLGREYVQQRLSYRALDVEQLGSVYEGLIDGMVKRADEVVVTIASGDQPVVPLAELEAREGDDLADYLRQVSSMSAKRAERVAAQASADQDRDSPAEVGAEAPHLDADTLSRVTPYADFLDVGATGQPSDLYIVQQSGARKAGGQYYTPKWITSFIAERTLEPLVYAGEGDDRRIKSPREILDLNVCDPAMGSGAFLVQACRYLAERLVESWEVIEAENGTHRGLTLPFGEPASGEQGEVLLPEDRAEAEMWARRYVADNCLYGVDVNRLAVELAKLSLWLVTLSADRPFTFLDHKLKQGNSIIGAWAEDIDRYPVKAWDRKADEPALKEAIKEIKRQVREQAKDQEKARAAGQETLAAEVPEVREEAAQAMREIEALDTLDPGEKERRFRELLEQNERYQAVKRMYDAWCALWFWPLTRTEDGQARTTPSSDLPLVWAYRELQQSLQRGGKAPVLRVVDEEQLAHWEELIEDLREEVQFFHWELEFADVFERGGFDAVVMNPPWERIKLQENEFFAGRAPEIVLAPNAAARKRLISQLPETDAALYGDYLHAKALADDTGTFLRESGHFPLTAVGDINLYPIFAGLGRRLINPRGGVGAVIPTGIATDYYTQEFFRDLMGTRSLSALYDFDNQESIFQQLGAVVKFCLLFLRPSSATPEFAFYLSLPEHVHDRSRTFRLESGDVALLNPNTQNCPIFRSKRDAELTKAVYRRHPVLVREVYDEDRKQVDEENPWGISFATMFHMTNDSGLFHTREELEAEGYELRQPGNHFVRGETVLLPLYEAKLFHQYNHRLGTFEGTDARDRQKTKAATIELTSAELEDPAVCPVPRYWVSEVAVREANPVDAPYHLTFRNTTTIWNRRTCIATILPEVGVGNSAPLLIASARAAVPLLANFNSSPFDYCVRQKAGGGNLNFYIVKQLPVIAPSRYQEEFCGERLSDIIAPRVLELTYTAWDIKAFAEDMGYDGPPFVWDEDRRAQLRAQLDAIYFHLYGIERDDVDYIMETFPIVKRKDEERLGEYRTKRLILGYYDAYAAGDLSCWLGPDDKREPEIHPNNPPEGMDP